MKDTERKKAAKDFAEYWKDKGYEKGESQKFWLSLLGEVLGVDDTASLIMRWSNGSGLNVVYGEDVVRRVKPR